MKAFTLRVPEWLHDEAVELFESLGMNMSTALNVFLRQCVINRGIPFQVYLDAQWDWERSGEGD